ncbi:transketolase C-terminal domain-containing protein [Listeria floridensis]|uniref:transketolase C-terminal domain-containing protein n=1 Tax=Listeria floridensis TaxID=1494962 RepID=UPI0030C6AF3A
MFKKHKKQGGVAANVIAEINDRAILSLEAPVMRVTAPDSVFPFSQAETVWLPNHNDIVERVKEVIAF